jgi:EAL domain-containing protein (putative c-di-GMP-specific phosphodiesterase class I)/CHASE2 domain-containing sensor protein
MIWPFRRKSIAKKPASRTRLFITALIFCTAIAYIDIPMPLEDLYRGARNILRARPADGKVVVVGIDAKTIKALGSSYYPRSYNAKALDQLFAKGAKRAYFDEAFSIPMDAAGDKDFEDSLRRHKGRAFIGVISTKSQGDSHSFELVPLARFREASDIRALHSKIRPFSLSIDQYYADLVDGKIVPSVSSDLANRKPIDATYFRPDWSIQVSTIPTISMIDVIEGKISASVLKDKDVLIGVTASSEPDFVQIPGQGWFPGVYTHAVGAQTLREGIPRDLGWMPAMALAILASAVVLWGKTRRAALWVTIGAVVVAIAVPFALDSMLIKMDYVSAYLMFGVVAYRGHTLRALSDARLKNAATLLPNLSALREEPLATSKPIIAMRIRNYAAVGASFSESVDSILITEIARRLTLPGQATNFYQAEDVLYWLGPALPQHELDGHLAGLARLMESLFVVQGRKIDVHVAFGVDLDVARPVANRIGRALLAADTAASKHQPYMFNTSNNDEESAWELSLMSELDAAVDAGDIWIAYQPQFELKTDRIIGAEALVRWQHPVRGAISPEAFILQAEEHNRISRLTYHVLELATRAAKPIIAQNPAFRLSINISATLMEQPQLPAMIVGILGRVGFPTSNLTLEVTESAPFAEHQAVASNLAGIAALGIDLSIDDYGTGNATLEYLRSVPCQEIKIDRSFVTSLVKDNGDMLLVESTIELAHGMGRRVIAEGIEDPETLELLRAIGCDIAQGYYLAKPMRIEALESLLSASSRIRAA